MSQQSVGQQGQGQHNQQVQQVQQVQQGQQSQQNQPLSISDTLATLMSKVQSLDGSMRRQTGDIAHIKNKVLNNQSTVEAAESNQQLTREEFIRAINYVVTEMAKQLNNNQQVLTNELKQIKQQVESVAANSATNKGSNAKANLNQNVVQNKVMGLFGGQTSVKVTLPLIGNVQLPLPIPAKFIKPAAVGGLVLFALILIFFGAR